MPPVDPPASSQPRSDLQVILSSALDMASVQNTPCDDILYALSEANGTPLLGTEADLEEKRKRIWALVFDSWNTNSTFHHPGTIAAKRLQHSAIIVGTFTQDHPASTEAQKAAKRKSSADAVVIPTTPAVRRAGQPVYIRPNVNMHEYSVVWQLTDGRGRTIQPEYFAYHPGITPESARADSMVHWDRNEVIRVCGFNRLLAVRQRCGITLAQGNSGQIGHSSPQLRTTNEKGNFVCPDSSQTTRLFWECRWDSTLKTRLLSCMRMHPTLSGLHLESRIHPL